MTQPAALAHIQALSPYVPGLSIAEIQARYGLDQIIKLASNENPLGASPLVQDAVRRHAASVFRYPQGGNPRLVKKLAEFHQLGPEKIVAGNGSDEIIDLLIRMLVLPDKHNIVCFKPCFSIYPLQAAIGNIETRQLPLGENFSFNFSGLIDLADENTRLVFITTPDNPSGYCPSLAETLNFANALARKSPKALLVIDEAYMDFADQEKDFSLLANHILPENTAFLRTFSKSFGLAGLRLGYAVLPPVIADSFWRVRLPFSINILAEEAGLAALEDTAFRVATIKIVCEGRRQISQGLEALGCKVWPSQANFLLFQLPETSAAWTAHEFMTSLLKKGVIIRPLKSYGLPEHLRVSVGNERENSVFLQRCREILQN